MWQQWYFLIIMSLNTIFILIAIGKFSEKSETDEVKLRVVQLIFGAVGFYALYSADFFRGMF